MFVLAACTCQKRSLNRVNTPRQVFFNKEGVTYTHQFCEDIDASSPQMTTGREEPHTQLTAGGFAVAVASLV